MLLAAPFLFAALCSGIWCFRLMETRIYGGMPDRRHTANSSFVYYVTGFLIMWALMINLLWIEQPAVFSPTGTAWATGFFGLLSFLALVLDSEPDDPNPLVSICFALATYPVVALLVHG